MEKIVVAFLAIAILLFAVALEKGHLNRRSLHKQKLLDLRIQEGEG